ncbi:MAG: DUF4912 domain-containing protein [Candidatus Omnitrophota bacterium]|nr:DUF4912 domain-containing protein [Candidatus Omnitrophota bacterium]
MEDSNSANAGFSDGRKFQLPSGYGDNKIVLMVRDPWSVFAYWEIKKDIEDGIREKIRGEGLTASGSVLRVYDVTDRDADRPSKVIYDFEIKDWANSWYIHTGYPGKKWMAEVGIICAGGKFFSLAGSNTVQTPSNRISDVLDENWMCPEDLYNKLFAAAGGIGKSSLEMRESMEQYLKKWLFSGGVTSGSSGSASRAAIDDKK